jgi:hypothetical protein
MMIGLRLKSEKDPLWHYLEEKIVCVLFLLGTIVSL